MQQLQKEYFASYSCTLCVCLCMCTRVEAKEQPWVLPLRTLGPLSHETGICHWKVGLAGEVMPPGWPVPFVPPVPVLVLQGEATPRPPALNDAKG